MPLKWEQPQEFSTSLANEVLSKQSTTRHNKSAQPKVEREEMPKQKKAKEKLACLKASTAISIVSPVLLLPLHATIIQ